MGCHILSPKHPTSTSTHSRQPQRARYRDEVLTPHLLSSMHLHRKVIQHDNVRPHTANQSVTVLPLPFKSSDLNPIEHLWGDLNRRVRSRQPAPQTLQELQQALEQNLGRIPQDRIRRLIECMPRRVRAVLQAIGGHNLY